VRLLVAVARPGKAENWPEAVARGALGDAKGAGWGLVTPRSSSRPATAQSVRDLLTSAGLPEIFIYDRQVNYGGVTTRVLPNDKLLLLPAPVDPNSPDGTALGATFWGQTLTSTDESYGIAPGDQPGIVAGVYRNEKPPMIAEVISDAIALPVLANASLSFAADVL